MNTALDIAISAFILFIVMGSRFNRWPVGQSALFTGQSSDYIDAVRYRSRIKQNLVRGEDGSLWGSPRKMSSSRLSKIWGLLSAIMIMRK